MTKKIKDYYKARSIRMSDKIWEEFVKYKPRDKSWEQFIKEILEIITYFKQL